VGQRFELAIESNEDPISLSPELAGERMGTGVETFSFDPAALESLFTATRAAPGAEDAGPESRSTMAVDYCRR
jgi:hypothetical protein